MKKFSYSLVYTSLFLMSTYALAETSATLGEVVVSGTPFSQKVGTQKITQEQIQRRPTTNSTITGLLKTNTSARFSVTNESSLGAGEIAPPEVSFHGEKFYNNNFTIDGFSNNDNMNPGFGSGSNDAENPDGTNPYDLPAGGTQSMWINPDLLKSVEVFDSNISAKYGRFTGGVIDAQIKDPDFEKSSGKVYYRTTRDTWASFHVQEGSLDEFNSAQKYVNQPKFTKHSYGVQVSQPLSDKASLLFAYDKTESLIPFNHNQLRDASKTSALEGTYADYQKKVSETFLLNGVYLADNGDVWKAKVIYSPHSSRMPKKNIHNGGMKNTGGGIQTTLEWEKDLSWGKMFTSFGYKKTGDKIEHDATDYRLYRRTASIPYRANGATVADGGYGITKTEKESYTLKQNYDLQPFDTADIEHKIRFGWQIDRNSAKYERETTAKRYTYVTTNIAKLTSCSDECILGEQYANKRVIYDPRVVKANDSNYSVYLEDTMKWKRLETTLGLRFDRSEFMKNNNISPRFSTTYDVFGNQNTRIFGGLNRYYSDSMLAYKLREGIRNSYTQTRTLNTATGKLSDWTYSNSNPETTFSYADVSGLKTPYSDEKVLGLSQKLLGGLWTIKWVHRDGKNQFTRSIEKNSEGNYYLTNNGWSKNDTLTLNLQPLETLKFDYAHIDWDFGIQWSRSKTNNSYYNQSTSSEEEEVTKAIYRGKLMDINELPPTNYNTPWKAILSVNTYFPKLRLNWDQQFSYTAGSVSRTGQDTINCPNDDALCGSFEGKAIRYDDEKHSGMFLVDWRFSYKQPTYKNQFLEITVDVNNVLNKRALIKSTSSTKTYKMGRNFWLGASYNW